MIVERVDDGWLEPEKALIAYSDQSKAEAFKNARQRFLDFLHKCAYPVEFLSDPDNAKWRLRWTNPWPPDHYDLEEMDEEYKRRGVALKRYAELIDFGNKARFVLESDFYGRLRNGEIVAIGTSYSAATEHRPDRSQVDPQRWVQELTIDFVKSAAVLKYDAKPAFLGVMINRSRALLSRQDGIAPLPNEDWRTWLEFIVKMGHADKAPPGETGPGTREKWQRCAQRYYGCNVVTSNQFRNEWTRLDKIYEKGLSQPGRKTGS
jgi:hypothetical protein